MVQDIFDNPILCKKCKKEMQKTQVSKNGFILRALFCPVCGSRILHPVDEQEYHRFINLKNREFRVKMRLVGNSYAVSIPKEIVCFMKEQERTLNDMVKLCFEDIGKLSLNFNNVLETNNVLESKKIEENIKEIKNGKLKT
jgi:hypothetical protein